MPGTLRVVLAFAARFRHEQSGLQVLLVPQHDRVGGLSVAPRAAYLLIIALDRKRHAAADHVAHIGLVDAHAEPRRRDHHRRPPRHERLLRRPLLVVAELAVVERGGHACSLERAVDSLGFGNRDAIEDSAFVSPRACSSHAPRLALVVGHAHNGKRKVGAVERGDYLQGVLQAKGLGDVFADPRGCRRRQRDHSRALVEPLDERADFAVVAAEVVAPFADAMGLIDGNEGDREVLDGRQESRVRQALRRNVQDLELAAFDAASNPFLSLRLKRVVEESGMQAQLNELPHLVAHERDQGRDHDGGAAERDGGDLVDQRFARSGGHDGQHVPFSHDGLDGPFLLRTEPIVPEAALQHFFRLLERCHVLSSVSNSLQSYCSRRFGPVLAAESVLSQIWLFPLLRFPICSHADGDTHPSHSHPLFWPCGAWGCLLWAMGGFADASSRGTIALEAGFGACGAGGGAACDPRCERE